MERLLKRIAMALALAFALATCTSEQVENGALASTKSWCRNSPQYCTVHDQSP
jgi:hypothetical protein